MPRVQPPIETEEQKRNREIVESIANNIAKLARSVHSLLNGPLKKKALVVLLSSSAGLPQKTVETVLLALLDLETDWLNK
jgi:hypothetical protein